MQLISDFHKADYKKIGFVPTMGFLHEGHLSLISRARQECDILVVSIFVNPKQFLPGEDFEQYPRDFISDYHNCRIAGTDYLFYPEATKMFPDDFLTEVIVNDLSDRLEGKYRPGHFKGVTTVVNKLINIVKPDFIFFGQKDAQQVVIVKKMVNDLNIDVDVRVCETVREDSGLAMSSRNIYLSEDQKSKAIFLNKALNEGKKLILEDKISDVSTVREKMENFLKDNSPDINIQYISVSDNVLMNEIENLYDYKGDIVISLAAYIGKTRLIDNIIFKNN